jgi:hypothetical protein
MSKDMCEFPLCDKEATTVFTTNRDYNLCDEHRYLIDILIEQAIKDNPYSKDDIVVSGEFVI